LSRALAAALLALALAGCGATPFEYHSGTEIPRGPGLLSGDDGAFVWRRDDDKGETKQ